MISSTPKPRSVAAQCLFFPYRAFCYGHGVLRKSWAKLSDEAYYVLLYMYYRLKRDYRNVTRIKSIYVVRSHTLVARSGLFETYDIATAIEKNKINGSFVECGVARGGCSALLAMVARENKNGRKTWMFDSFEGLPEPTDEDKSSVHKKPGKNRRSGPLAKGYCLGTYEEVGTLLFSKLGLARDNVFMVKGWFQDTLPVHKDNIGSISLLRLDGDWYESTKCCLDNLYDNVTRGGYVIIDDYHLPGCKKAVDEFLQNRGLIVTLTLDERGGGHFVKP